MDSQIRVRFAPSPTGYLHIGGVRTALFNYLFAKKEGGKFLLRIEDTDRERSKPEFEEEILDSLKWLSLTWDEPFFRQSARLDHYQQAIDDLIKNGLAYQIKEAGKFAVKIKVPRRNVSFEDLVHGPVCFEAGFTEDFVIQKSDGYPTYHFACVVDDHDMNISHVIRGDDHLSNTPKQLFIYQAFGWKTPKFAHLPLVFGSDRTPLSKRHSAVSVSAYRSEGYLPEGLLNYLALLGWSPKNNVEVFTLNELIALFQIGQINTTNACFDPEKLKWVNSEHIRRMSPERYAEGLRGFVINCHSDEQSDEESRNRILRFAQDDKFKQITLLYRNRLRTFSEFLEQPAFFFQENVTFDPEAVKKYLFKEEVRNYLTQWRKILCEEGDFSSPESLETLLRHSAEKFKIQAGSLIHPTRVAITGRSVSPGLFEVMFLLGKDVVLRRLEYVIINFKHLPK